MDIHQEREAAKSETDKLMKLLKVELLPASKKAAAKTWCAASIPAHRRSNSRLGTFIQFVARSLPWETVVRIAHAWATPQPTLPQPPLEASGTSGMKAALNGVPSLSILDGWWIEGCIEGATGWAIGEDHSANNKDSRFLLDKLEQMVVPIFYRERLRFVEIMRHAIALNGAFFNTHRMMQQYATKAYLFGGHLEGVDHARRTV